MFFRVIFLFFSKKNKNINKYFKTQNIQTIFTFILHYNKKIKKKNQKTPSKKFCQTIKEKKKKKKEEEEVTNKAPKKYTMLLKRNM
jgi:aspartyl aminopeptidase